MPGMEAAKDDLLFASDFPLEAVLRDHTDPETGGRYLVVRGFLSFCVYVGVPASHPFAGMQDLRLSRRQNYERWGEAGTLWPEGYYWWGWDYAGVGSVLEADVFIPDDLPAELKNMLHRMMNRPKVAGMPVKKWTLGEVEAEAKDALEALSLASGASRDAAAAILKARNRFDASEGD